MVSKLRDVSVLIVGMGSIGKRHARVLRELGVRHIWCHDDDHQKMESAEEIGLVEKLFESYQDGLTHGPDAVFVCTPPDIHVEQIEKAVLSGADVFCEKPLSWTTRGLDELMGLVQQQGRHVMVGLCFRLHDGLALAHRYLKEGRIGRLVAIRAMIGEYLPDVRPDYQDLYLAQENGVYELIHEVDLCCWFADSEPLSVSAISGSRSDIRIAADDIAELLIDFRNQVVASVHLDFFQRSRRRQTELLGTEGTIIVEFSSWDQCTISMYTAAEESWVHRTITTSRDDMFREEDDAFLECVATRKPPSMTVKHATHSVAIVEAARKASAERRVIPVGSPSFLRESLATGGTK